VGVRVAVSAGAGSLGALVVAIVGPWWLIPLSGWDLAALLFVSWMWRSPSSTTKAQQGVSTSTQRERPVGPLTEQRVTFLDAASSTPVGTHEQQHNHNEKQKNERAYEGAAGEAKNDQGDNEQQKQIHERPFV